MTGRHAHFVGIGGIGMSGIARVLLELGWTVSGSDLRASRITGSLEELGARIFVGHAAENLGQADLLVVSSAVPSANPELVRAQETGIPVWTRGQMLGHVMETRRGVAVAGTHGKTTTTSMVARVLEQGGFRPTVIIGGEVNDIGSNAKLGEGGHLVAEADESDASFLDLYPRIAVVTNIDSDVNLSAPSFADCNFDYEKTMERIREVFRQFMLRVPQDGLLVLCTDNANVRDLIPTVDRPVTTYGLNEGAELSAREVELFNFSSRCVVTQRGEPLGELHLRVPGRHNIQNALAAVAIGLHEGLSFSEIARALSRFEGVQRRFQLRGEFGGVMLVDDYAHNPAKVRAAVHAARSGWAKRVVAVFQPHRYTRTKFLSEEFGHSFEEADVVLVTEIYSAGEVPIVGVKADLIVDAVRRHGRPAEVFHTPGVHEVGDFLARYCRPGDLVLTLGAGDVSNWTPTLADYLGKPVLRRAAM
ncbi:MAG: UDP-N-acetylmuramate--L-alanine ligase [Candidatus Eremiobacterota bacterium]